MKKIGKILSLAIVVGAGMVSLHTYASTGITYTGNLESYMQSQKSSLSTAFDTAYANVYNTFQKTGLSIMKSAEYQGLVCLGALKDQNILSQMQKDAVSYRVSFNKDFVELEKKISGLEEKKDIQDQDGVSMFDSGSSYDIEKAQLKTEIDTKIQTDRSLMSGFVSTYTSKIAAMISSFQQYLAPNQQLLQTIKTRMAKVDAVVDAFSGVENSVEKINAKITGLDDVIAKMETAKSQGLTSLDKLSDTLIAKNAKIYKKFLSLSGDLEKQKSYILGLYQLDLDEYLTNSLQNRYDRSAYLSLKDDIDAYRAKYYSSQTSLNCSNVLSANDDTSGLLARIAAMKISVDSGLQQIQKNGVSSALKDQILSGFQSTYLQKFTQRYNEFVAYIGTYIKQAAKSLTQSVSQSLSSPSADEETGTVTQTTTVIFTKPFKSGQYSQDIGALQNILTSLGFYTGAIDNTYTAATKQAVYQFQLSRGLLKGYENKPDVRGYFGPATRAAINNLAK